MRQHVACHVQLGDRVDRTVACEPSHIVAVCAHNVCHATLQDALKMLLHLDDECSRRDWSIVFRLPHVLQHWMHVIHEEGL